MDLSSKFYTYCPHDFGRSVPTVLDTDSIVQQKKEVMLTLSDIELTQSLQKAKVVTQFFIFEINVLSTLLPHYWLGFGS